MTGETYESYKVDEILLQDCRCNMEGVVTMCHGIYICDDQLKKKESGVAKKIHMQIDAFRKMGIEMELPELFKDTKIDRIVRRTPLLIRGFDKNLRKYILEHLNVEFVYIRNVNITPYFVETLKLIRDAGIPVIYEFPTFPYDHNSHTLKWKLSMLKEKRSRGELHKYVRKVVNFSNYDNIYGIESIRISNGIAPDKITPQNKRTAANNKIVFSGVALLTYWNGYDRLMQGIADYYQGDAVNKKDIYFNIAGDGEELKKLKRMAQRLRLQDRVVFHGFISGQKLEDIYNQTDIAVGTLAPFRKYKDHVMSTLKTKEYTAKGIPFIKGDRDDVFDDAGVDFCFNVTRNESPINLNEIVDWYENLKILYPTNNELIQHVRSFAFDSLTWVKQLEPVAAYISSVAGRQNL